jgi:hypothetical protein
LGQSCGQDKGCEAQTMTGIYEACER